MHLAVGHGNLNRFFSDSKRFGWNLEVPKASGNLNEPLLVGG